MDDQMRKAVEFVRREERRRAEEQAREAWHDGYEEGEDEGYHEGYKEGYRKGWVEAGGDPRVAEIYGLRSDDRAWARGVLHLGEAFSAEEVQRRYRELSKVFHPDVFGSDAYFKDLGEAKRILTGDS